MLADPESLAQFEDAEEEQTKPLEKEVKILDNNDNLLEVGEEGEEYDEEFYDDYDDDDSEDFDSDIDENGRKITQVRGPNSQVLFRHRHLVYFFYNVSIF